MEQPRSSRPAKARLSSVANSIRLLNSFSGEEDELGITTLAEFAAAAERALTAGEACRRLRCAAVNKAA